MKRVFKNGWKALATIVLVVGLVGGPAYAAGLAKNSVRSKHIKDGQVKTQDLGDGAVATAKLADNAVTGGKIANNSVTASKLASNSVTNDKIANGAVGTDQLANGSVTGGAFGKLGFGTIFGVNIANGTVGDTKLGQLTIRTQTVNVSNGTVGQAIADCDAGETAMFAGADWDLYSGVSLAQQALAGTGGASGAPHRALVIGTNNSGSTRQLTAQVLCLA